MEIAVVSVRQQLDHVMSGPDKTLKPGKRSNNTQQRKKHGVGFTFVDQSDDLRSLADKRIVSKDQRHVIRSHVMRSVRHAENEQGVKRPTGREGTKRTSSTPSRPSSITPKPERTNSDASLETSPASTTISPITPTDSNLNALTLLKTPTVQIMEPRSDLFFEPEANLIIHNLVNYCFEVFIPMTFPIESKSPGEAAKRQNTIMQSRYTRPATFFGMLSAVAAHRAIFSGRHQDLTPSNANHDELLLDQDFSLMKHHTIVNTRTRIRQEDFLDGDVIEAVFALVGAATTIGNFTEARTHLRYIQQVVSENGHVDAVTQPASAWVPLYDVTCATGTLSRPLFRLPWEGGPIPQDVASRISPDSSSLLYRSTWGFRDIPDLSYRILEIMQLARSICFLCEFNASDLQGLNAREHDLFRNKTLELQYDVLSYVYEGSPSQGEKRNESINLTPLEQIVRLGILGVCNSSITRVLPTSGLGRAMTKHQKTALEKWFTSIKSAPSIGAQRITVWALFIFILCADGQKEVQSYESILVKVIKYLRITRWEEVEMLLYDFVYLPSLQRSSYQRFWKSLQRRMEQSTTPPSR